MPRIGMGTWPMDDADSERAVSTAIDSGYRLIDTAQAYGNERGVGRGIKSAGTPRTDLFITSKFNREWHGAELVRAALQASLDRLQLDYLDMFMIHWPNPAYNRYIDAFEGLLQLHQDGVVRAIGTSNFKPTHLDKLRAATGELPDVNQIQLSPGIPRTASRAYHTSNGIATQSWSPLGGQESPLLSTPIVARIAEAHGRSAAQVVLRWHIEHELVPIPKSSDPRRLAQNLDVFDFELNGDQITELDALDLGGDEVTDSDYFGH